jgi:addiction module HigA family antidote
MVKQLPPMHPGEVLREEFLAPLNLSAGALAKACDLPRTRIERIAAETSGITADTALRLSKVLGTTPEVWLNLQRDYDVETARLTLGNTLDKIKPISNETANDNADASSFRKKA